MWWDKYWSQVILGGLLCLSTYGWYNTGVSLRKAREENARFVYAQKIANDNAQEVKKQLIKEAETNATEADKRYDALYAKYRTSLLRYKASQSTTTATDHSDVQATESSDGPSTGTKLSITTKDADICAVNTARLQAVQEWATHATEIGKVQENSQLEHQN